MYEILAKKTTPYIYTYIYVWVHAIVGDHKGTPLQYIRRNNGYGRWQGVVGLVDVGYRRG